MGITLDTNNYLLFSMFNISPQKLNTEYSGMSIEEIMKAEAQQGNTAAAHFDQSILSNPAKFIELFGLQDAGNKYAILSNMNERDLKDMLPLLNQADLLAGINFFTKDKLLDLFKDLPKDQLVKFVFQMFSPEQIMHLMPDEEMNKVLSSTEMKGNKGFELKHLKSMRPEILAKMIESAIGQKPAGVEIGLDGQPIFDKKALLEQLESLPDDKFQEAMLSMPTVNKQNFILQMGKENPKIFELFESDAYMKIVEKKKNKEEMVKAASVIDPEQLIKMVEQLPQDLTAIVLTQIDVNKFADLLLANFKNIIGQLMAG